ncbi:MAG: NAD(P)/FAD-dependent oxidoreductase [Actinomycetota bacterium]|nr:NAD(P)/FAD-dependent oxidoreductase [Actinomycetota bacterium]
METRLAQTDVAVVGGGMSGLTAACYLARAGLAVTVFEKAPIPGGRAATREFDGFLFNRGGHALYTGGAGSRILEELGIYYDYGIPKDTFVLQGGKLSPFPADPLGLLRTDFLGAADKLALVRFLVAISRARPAALARTSVQEWLDTEIRRPQLRRVIAAFARTFAYSTALDLVSAEMFVDKFQRALRHPIHYVDGGWRVLVDALRDAAEQAGARVVSGAGVESVELVGDRAVGVRLRDGSLVRSSAVVLATGPREAARLADGSRRQVLRRTVESLIPARIACLDVALSRLPVPDRPVVQDLDRPRFMSAQSVYSRIAPEGAALIISFKQLDPRHPGDPQEDERDLEELLDAAQPGWRDVLVRRQYLPRIEAVSALPIAAEGGFASRPDTEVPGIANLCLAGDWGGSEGFLIDASMASARRAARLLIEDVRLSQRRMVAGSVR